MTQRAPERSRQSYRHEAFLWHDAGEFTRHLNPFIDEGLQAGEPVMVAVTPEHTQWLRDSLSATAADRVTFVDMTELGRNPARIIPAWRDFAPPPSTRPAQPARGIGEPVWPGRHSHELIECQLHEALLNVAIDPDTPLWLVCPYDAASLPPAVIEEAYRSHPVVVEGETHRGSRHYAGRAHVEVLFGSDLPEPAQPPREAMFTAETLRRLLSYVQLELYVAGQSIEQAGQLAAAVHQLALDSLGRGSPRVVVRIWTEPSALVCEVVDEVAVADPLLGRIAGTEEHDGLWRANLACDLVQVRSKASGTTVRILTWR